MGMTDHEFLRQFEDTTLPDDAFPHRAHIRMAWLYVRREGAEGAVAPITEGIRRFATAKGAPGMYHHTMTLVWLRLVAAALRKTPDVSSFDVFWAAHPHLGDKRQPQRFYSEGTLWSPAARAGWIEPDLAPLP
jgi:hypothetical protein